MLTISVQLFFKKTLLSYLRPTEVQGRGKGEREMDRKRQTDREGDLLSAG